MKTVKQLRDEGCKVVVRHVRLLNKSYFNPDFGGEDNLLTRREFEVLSQGQDKFGQVVQPKGGFTEVKIVTPDGKVYYGKHNYNSKRFERKIGVKAAIGKALK